jgi:hypothetical protein
VTTNEWYASVNVLQNAMNGFVTSRMKIFFPVISEERINGPDHYTWPIHELGWKA